MPNVFAIVTGKKPLCPLAFSVVVQIVQFLLKNMELVCNRSMNRKRLVVKRTMGKCTEEGGDDGNGSGERCSQGPTTSNENTIFSAATACLPALLSTNSKEYGFSRVSARDVPGFAWLCPRGQKDQQRQGEGREGQHPCCVLCRGHGPR